MANLLDFNDPANLMLLTMYLCDKNKEAEERRNNQLLREHWNNIQSDVARELFIQCHGTDWMKDTEGPETQLFAEGKTMCEYGTKWEIWKHAISDDYTASSELIGTFHSKQAAYIELRCLERRNTDSDIVYRIEEVESDFDDF